MRKIVYVLHECELNFFRSYVLVRTNRRAIATMFVRLSCLSGTGVHCDHTVHLTWI